MAPMGGNGLHHVPSSFLPPPFSPPGFPNPPYNLRLRISPGSGGRSGDN